MPAYKDEERGTWYVKFNYEDWNGQKKTKLKRGFARKKDALAFETEFKSKYTGANTGMTMNTLLDLYIADCAPRVKEVTLHQRKLLIDKHMRPWFGHMLAAEVKPVNVREWQTHCLSKEYKPGKYHSATAVSTWHQILSSAFNFGVTFHGLKDNPAKLCGPPAKRSKRKKAIKHWTREQFEEYLNYVPRREYRFLFTTLFYSGMRIGEALALKQDDIDLEGSTIRVDETYAELPGKTVLQPPKTESSIRYIRMPEFYMQELKAYLDWCYGLSEDDRIFFWAKHVSTVHDYFVMHQENTGLPRLTTHNLRDSHASLLIDMNMPVLMIADRLGHSDPSMTLKVYSHLYQAKHTELADKLDEIKSVSNEYHDE